MSTGNSIIPTERQHDEHFAPCCAVCGTRDDLQACDDGQGKCKDCAKCAREVDLEDGWLCFAERVEFSDRAKKLIEQIDSVMFREGWKYTDAVLRHERTSRGVRVYDADTLLFTRGKMTATWTRQDKQPVLTVAVADDWKVTASIETPLPIIEALLSRHLP